LAEFRGASELLEEKMNNQRLTTGNANLDSLIGSGIERGLFYLFYGDEESEADLLIHRILVNILLPAHKLGWGGKCVCTQ